MSISGRSACICAFAAFLVVSISRADDDKGSGSVDRFFRSHHTWHVSASAASGGDGSAGKPFASLALVQQASGPGDTIIVDPSPLSVPPLNGGIALQAG